MNSIFKLFSFFIFISFIFSCKKEGPELNPVENRLGNSSSPYLKEHADNPVDWYEWGPEALEKAQKEDKPIVISIGYSACHWCHVMEEESFMDSTVAKLMNENFVSIKIDREQRPDIDEVYMQAAQLLNGNGGWPLNVFALPDGKPFYAGTYFEKNEWEKLLAQIAKTYKNNKSDLESTANALTEGIRKANQLTDLKLKGSEISEKDYVAIKKNWEKSWDLKRGGYLGEEKFPLPVSWNSLLEYYHLTKDEKVLSFLDTTLKEIAHGGLYDQLGGGFSRYTVDSRWRTPHFEKMLYDNALLISLYSNYFKVSGGEEYEKIVEKSLDFIEKELSNGKGGYYSSMNADSEGEEGKYYAWSLEEIKKLLSKKETEVFADFYNVEGYGNWENGKNILYTNQSLTEFAKSRELELSEVKEIIEKAKNKLLSERQSRKIPSIDNKVITSWNALMINGYLDAYKAFGDPDYLKKAIATGNFLKDEMLTANNKLKRGLSKDSNEIFGFSEDYAFLIRAYIDLYQVTFDKKWLDLANELSSFTLENFRDEESGMFYFNSAEQGNPIARRIDVIDDVLPSSNSVMAENLFIIGTLTENEEFLNASERMLKNLWPELQKNPSSYANWIRLVGLKALGIYEIAIMGEEALIKNKEMQSEYLPTAIFMGGTSENLPLLKSKLVKGKTVIYVCQNKTCKYPVENVQEAFNLIKGTRSNSDIFSGYLQ